MVERKAKQQNKINRSILMSALVTAQISIILSLQWLQLSRATKEILTSRILLWSRGGEKNVQGSDGWTEETEETPKT